MPEFVPVAARIAEFTSSPLARWADLQPREITAKSKEIISAVLETTLDDESTSRTAWQFTEPQR